MTEDIARGSVEDIYERTDAYSRHVSTLHVLRFFAWKHLPQELAQVSERVGETAIALTRALPDGPELTAGLRKLLEAKDCFVRAAVDGL